MIVGLTVGLLPGLNAQQTVQQPIFRSGIDLVQVDVSVLGRDHRPVHGLTAADFTLVEDGVVQQIQAFTEISVPDADHTKAPWTRDVAPDVVTNNSEDGRIFVVLIDDAMIRDGLRTPDFIETVRRVTSEVFDRLGPSDLASVIFTLDDRANQDFTNDRARLRDAVSHFKPGNFSFSDPNSPYSSAGSLGALGGSGAFFPTYSGNAVGKMAEHLADIPRQRKALIYVSQGFGVVLDPMNTRHSANEALLALRATEALDKAQRSSVTVYGVSPNGLSRPGVDGADTEMNPEKVLESLLRPPAPVPPGVTVRNFAVMATESTGGFLIGRPDQLQPGLDQMFRETGSYYLLGFKSTNSGTDGKFRKLEVRVAREDLQVRSRTGYFAAKPTKPSDGSKPAPPPVNLAITGILPAKEIPVRTSVAAFAVPGQKNAAVAIALGLRRPSSDTALDESVDLLVQAFTTKGDSRGAKRIKARLVLPNGSGSDVRYEVLSRIDLPPGRYELRLGAHSALQGRSGSVYVTVDVPDFVKEPLTLSGLMLTVTPPTIVAPKDALAGLLPIVPTTLREFSTGHEVAAFLRIYQGGKTPLAHASIAVSIRDDADAAVYDETETIAPARFDTSRAADYRIDLPVGLLPPGQYLLAIDATVGGATARRTLRFVVR